MPLLLLLLFASLARFMSAVAVRVLVVLAGLLFVMLLLDIEAWESEE
jgi:hypothetical protein